MVCTWWAPATLSQSSPSIRSHGSINLLVAVTASGLMQMRLLALVTEEEEEEEGCVEDSAREVTVSLRLAAIVTGVSGSEEGVLAESVVQVVEVRVVAEAGGYLQ